MEVVAPALGHVVEERTVLLQEVMDADEIFLTGTAAEVIGVSHIGERVIGCGKVGNLTAQLEGEFRRRVANDAPED